MQNIITRNAVLKGVLQDMDCTPNIKPGKFNLRKKIDKSIITLKGFIYDYERCNITKTISM